MLSFALALQADGYLRVPYLRYQARPQPKPPAGPKRKDAGLGLVEHLQLGACCKTTRCGGLMSLTGYRPLMQQTVPCVCCVRCRPRVNCWHLSTVALVITRTPGSQGMQSPVVVPTDPPRAVRLTVGLRVLKGRRNCVASGEGAGEEPHATSWGCCKAVGWTGNDIKDLWGGHYQELLFDIVYKTSKDSGSV